MILDQHTIDLVNSLISVFFIIANMDQISVLNKSKSFKGSSVKALFFYSFSGIWYIFLMSTINFQCSFIIASIGNILSWVYFFQALYYRERPAI